MLGAFHDLEISVSKGNVIFPAGNAERFLGGYFPEKEVDLSEPCGAKSYTSPPDRVKCLSVEPDGSVVACCFPIGNLYEEDIDGILDRYDPYRNEAMSALLKGGVPRLLEYAETKGIHIDRGRHSSACGVCREVVSRLFR